MKKKILVKQEDITNLKQGDLVYYRGLKTPFRCLSNQDKIVTLHHCKTGKRERVIAKSGQVFVKRIIENFSDAIR